jgi:septin 3/9/12
VLKKLAEVVNVVPVIAKSDSLTLEERATFKARVSDFALQATTIQTRVDRLVLDTVPLQLHIALMREAQVAHQLIRQIMAELLHNQIRLYPFDVEELDETELELNERIRVRLSSLAPSLHHGIHCSAPFFLVWCTEQQLIKKGHAPIRRRRI